MFMEESQIKKSLGPFLFCDLLLKVPHLFESSEFPHYAFKPLDSQVIVIFVFFLHDGSLVHQLIGKFDLAFIVALNTAFIEHL